MDSQGKVILTLHGSISSSIPSVSGFGGSETLVTAILGIGSISIVIGATHVPFVFVRKYTFLQDNK